MRLVIALILGVVSGLAARRYLVTAERVSEGAAPVEVEAPASPQPAADSSFTAVRPPVAAIANPAYEQREAVYVRGYIQRGTKINVSLSDGTTWTERDPKLEKLERGFVVYDGKKYPLRVQWSKPPLPGVDWATGNQVDTTRAAGRNGPKAEPNGSRPVESGSRTDYLGEALFPPSPAISQLPGGSSSRPAPGADSPRQGS